MSKPVVKIALVLLVGIIILAGIFATVQAAASTAGVMSGNHSQTAGLLGDQKLIPASKSQFQPYMPKGEGPGGCDHEGINPGDL